MSPRRDREREVRAFLTQFMDTIDRHIQDTGWMVQGVLASDSAPGWAYTIGYGPTLNHPEMMLVGLPADLSMDILNDVGERIRAGEPLEAAQTCPNLVRVAGGGVVPTYVTAIPPAMYPDWFGAGLRYYRERQLGDPVWHQLVWPDAAGLLPWQDGFDRRFDQIQPVLGPVPS